MIEPIDKPGDIALSSLGDAFVNGLVNLGSLHDTLFSKNEEIKETTVATTT